MSRKNVPAAKVGFFAARLNAVYAIGGPLLWAALWSVASVLVFDWSWLTLRRRFSKREQ